MGFFDKKPQTAIQKDINAKLAYINDIYLQIGRYVKLNMSETIEDANVKQMLGNIDAALNDIKDLNEKLNALNGVKTCPNCGKKIAVEAIFCATCGTRQPDIVQNNPVQQTVPPVQQNVVPPVQQPQPKEENNAAASVNVNSGVGVIPDTAVNPVPQTEQVSPVQTPPTPQAQEPQPTVQPLNTPQNTSEQPAVQTPPPAVESIPNEEQEDVPQDFVVCTACGSKEDKQMSFCSQCGAKL